MRTRLHNAGAICSLLLFVWAGCDRGDGAAQQPSPTTGGATTTQPDGGTARAPGIPQVGLPAATAETYKPVVGRYGGQMVRDQLGEPKSFNPIVSSETSTSDYTYRMFEGLTRGNSFTGEVEPGLAESWSVADDKLAWTFKLRKGVVFNDGTPFHADDVVFSWNDLVYDLNRPASAKDPRWPSGMRDLVTFDGKIIKIEEVDNHTVRFTTPFPLAILPDIVGAQILCSKEKYAAAVADGSFGGKMAADASPADIVGTGPWMLGSYSRGERVVLTRNPNYWRKDAAGNPYPYLDEIVFVLSRNYDALYLNFERGVTDIYHCLRGGKDIASLRPMQEKGNFKLYQLGPDHGDVFLALNMNLDAGRTGKLPEYKVNWFRDQRFRQAVSYAVDRTSIVRNIYRNLGYPQYTSFSVAPGPFKIDVPPIPRDFEKSKALLADMGLTDRDGDGIIEDEQGRKVQFTIVTNSGNATREETCNYLATDLRKIGMEVNPLFLEFNQLIDRLDVSHDWEAMVMGFTSSWDPHSGSNFWKSSSTNHLWWPKQAQPGFPWEKRLDEIFVQGVQELDPAKRKALYAEAFKIAYDQQPMVYLAVKERVDAIRSKFGNVFPSPAPLWEFAAFHNEDEMFLLDSSATTAAPRGGGER